ncbi:MAG: fibronectin type III domain-containing protein, partial [Patescibacteria group bacterium]
MLEPAGTLHKNLNGSDYLCAPVTVGAVTYESWVACGTKIGPNGGQAAIGENQTAGGKTFKCCPNNEWSDTGYCQSEYDSGVSMAIKNSSGGTITGSTLLKGRPYTLEITVANSGGAPWEPVYNGTGDTGGYFLIGAGNGGIGSDAFANGFRFDGQIGKNRFVFGSVASPFNASDTRTTSMALIPENTGTYTMIFKTLREWTGPQNPVIPGWFGTPAQRTFAVVEPGSPSCEITPNPSQITGGSGSATATVTWSNFAEAPNPFNVDCGNGTGFSCSGNSGCSGSCTYTNSTASQEVKTISATAESALESAECAATVTVKPAIPAAPTLNASQTVVTADSVTLHWTDNSNNETGFRIKRAGTVVGSVTSGTTYMDSGLVASTVYTYTVVSYNNGGDSPESNQITVTTLSSGVPPTACNGICESSDISGTGCSSDCAFVPEKK